VEEHGTVSYTYDFVDLLSTQVLSYVAILSTEGCGKAVQYAIIGDPQTCT